MKSAFDLFQVNGQIHHLIENNIDDETGEINDEITAQLNELQIEMDTKIVSVANYTKCLDAMIEAGKLESRRIADHVGYMTNLKDRLKTALKAFVPEGEKVVNPETGKILISWRKSKSLDILDDEKVMAYCEKSLPEAIKTPEPYLLKSEIKKAIQDGVGIDGAELIQKNNIQIR